MDRPIVVADRIATASAVVALESSVLAQGLPAPANLESAEAQSLAVCKADAEPAVVGVIGGRILVGADHQQVKALASGAVHWKVTVRDLAYVVARGLDGATTVSATAFAAEAVGIDVMATGGIGGVHFGAGDVSADLPQLARSRLTVVCSGPKHVADAAATMEWLETHGVLVVGYRTDRLPGFLAPGRLPLEHTVDGVRQVVELIRVRRALQAPGALVLVQDPPPSAAMEPDELAELAAAGAAAARDAGVFGKARTPFELDWLHRRTGGRSLTANLALLEANAGLAGEIAAALAAG
ncbi:MAG TPA: pseudouridine-5'-phosphate glycosidase [Actinomycetes bacterium]|nr:pseudouridine-5'-phosphate glycosidase [Actinomycetes bacterium]